MIKLVNVSKTYGEKDGRVEALKSTNLLIPDHELVAILGKTGSGKTTLLNMIGALDKPTTGEIFFGDDDITKMNEDELADYRNRNIGYVFQSFYLDDSSSVIDNVMMPEIIAGIGKEKRTQKARKYLTILGISEKESTKVRDLSGGQKQRVAVARALVNDPDVILADEPTGNLDSENGKEVLELLKTIVQMGKTVILVTHNVADAEKYADVIFTITDGVIQ